MVDITSRMESSGNYEIEGLKLEFLTESKAYYSSFATQEVAEKYGDIKTAVSGKYEILLLVQNTQVKFC